MSVGIKLTGVGYVKPPGTDKNNINNQAETGKKAFQTSKSGFSDQLQHLIQSGEIKLSKHAASRLESRNMELSDGERTMLRQAINDMQAKGTKNGLVIIEDKAVVVSVPNRTVITVLDTQGARGNVFTNIDGAVIA